MQLTRNSIETARGPSDWFTGAVYIDAVAAPAAGSRLSASSVHFTPGARTAWHTHPNGQTIYVIEGIGRAQRRGGPVEEIRPGDRVFFEPGNNMDAPCFYCCYIERTTQFVNDQCCERFAFNIFCEN